MEQLFKDFLKEKEYLCNLSPKTLISYEQSFKAYKRVVENDCIPTKDILKDFVIGLRQEELAIGACNVYIRSINSFLSWLHENGHTPEHLKVKQIKGDRPVVKVFKPAHIQALIRFRPQNPYDHRLHTLVCLLIDTGARIDEALSVKLSETDLDQLFLHVIGKGRKGRVLPISAEMRKRLWVYIKRHRFDTGDYLFSTREGNRIGYNNALRDIKNLCRRVGIEGVRLSPHGFRHFYSVNYISQGGDIYRLSKILGHTDVSTTSIYLRSMGVEMVQQIHQQLSPLSRY